MARNLTNGLSTKPMRYFNVSAFLTGNQNLHGILLYKARSSGSKYLRKTQLRPFGLLFFCQRIKDVWNSLPVDVDFSSLGSFTRWATWPY